MEQQIETDGNQTGRRNFTNIRDLLTAEQQAELDDDLQAAAQTRIRAAGSLAINQDRY